MKKALFLFILLALASACYAQQASKGTITMYFFWGNGCPHCEEMKPFIQQMQNTYPQLNVKSLETFKDPANNQLFNAMAKAYNKTAEGVPGTFIGEQMFEGYAKGVTDKQVTAAIESCIKNGCPDPDQKLAEYLIAHPTTTTTTLPEPKPAGMDPAVMAFGALIVVVLLALVIKNRKQLM
jgi:thiol-disulfide isomerase/thioredoxin